MPAGDPVRPPAVPPYRAGEVEPVTERMVAAYLEAALRVVDDDLARSLLDGLRETVLRYTASSNVNGTPTMNAGSADSVEPVGELIGPLGLPIVPAESADYVKSSPGTVAPVLVRRSNRGTGTSVATETVPGEP